MIFFFKRCCKFFTPALLIALLSPAAGHSQVVINEIQSSNSSTIADEDGDYEDWIELFNKGSEAVDIGLNGLSDDYDHPFRWIFPEGTVIGPGAFLLIWASDKDRRSLNGRLHTNFRISQSGEPILFTDYRTGERIDEIPPLEIPTDQSYGRYPDGSDNLELFTNPTPGESNSGGSPAVQNVIFSASGGFHSEPFDLELLSEHPDAEIRYTLDGSEPDAQSTRYTGPIHIDDRTLEPNDLSAILEISHNYANAALPADNVFKGTVVRAIAFVRGGQSGVNTRTFFVHPEGGGRFSLPVISLVTHRDNLFGYEEGIYVLGKVWDDRGQGHALHAPANYNRWGDEWERPVHMEMFEADGSLAVSQDIGVRLHGGASRAFPQKSFRLYSRSDYGTSRFRHRFFPEMELDDFNRLILRQSGQDVVMTLFRDAYIHESMKHLQFPTQASRAAILFLNGEYWGIYNIRERYDIHYLETHYGVDRDQVDLMTGNASLKNGSRVHYDALRAYFNNNDPRDDAHFRHIQTMMDTDNFMDYYIANIYARNTDWPHNNVDYWRYQTSYNPDASIPEQDGRWRWMMFDMDFCFGWQAGPGGWAPYRPNDWSRPGHYDRKSYLENMFDWVDSDNSNRPWSTYMYRRLMRNETWRRDFLLRFADLLNTTYQPDRMTAILDSMAAIYAPEIEEHIIRWNKTEPENWDFYWRPFITFEEWEKEVNVMRRFVGQRHHYQWEHLRHYAGRGGRSITLDVSDPSHGHIRINSIPIHPDTEGVDDDPWPWTGSYFFGIDTPIVPEPAPEYVFHRWMTVVGGDTLLYSTDEKLTVNFRNNMNLIAEFRHVSVDAADEAGAADGAGAEVPAAFSVRQNYPNPFNHMTVIPFELPDNADMVLEVYTADGRLVRREGIGYQRAGVHTVRFDASGLASGVYIARMHAKDGPARAMGSASVKITLVR